MLSERDATSCTAPLMGAEWHPPLSVVGVITACRLSLAVMPPGQISGGAGHSLPGLICPVPGRRAAGHENVGEERTRFLFLSSQRVVQKVGTPFLFSNSIFCLLVVVFFDKDKTKTTFSCVSLHFSQCFSPTWYLMCNFLSHCSHCLLLPSTLSHFSQNRSCQFNLSKV